MLQAAALNENSRTIIFVHYAGHGQEIGGNLHFVGPTGKTFNVAGAFFNEVDESSFFGESANVDVVFILDSCYSNIDTRSAALPGRMVEVLAAVDESDPTAFSPGTRASFTSNLLNEIAARKGRGDRDVEFAELIEFLRGQWPVKKPTHARKTSLFTVALLKNADFPCFGRPFCSLLMQVFFLHSILTFGNRDFFLKGSVTTSEIEWSLVQLENRCCVYRNYYYYLKQIAF